MLEQLGKIVLDLPPASRNPRNSEGAFLELEDGRLLFAYSRFTGDSYDDTSKACIAVCYSADEGSTWSEPRIIARPEDHEAMNIMSSSLLHMRNGDIGLFYLIRYGWHDLRLNLRRSSDEGETWSEPICCIPGMGYFVTNNDRVVRLSSGRLVVPAGYHKLKGESRTDWKSFDGRAITCFFLSDDDGLTWRESRNFCALISPHSQSGLQEPGLIELRKDVLWAWARTDMGRQYEMFSFDGGETWSEAGASGFISPNSPLSMKRIPDCDFLMAVWNPIPNYVTRPLEKHSWGRTPLIGAISKDNGRTWEGHFAVEGEDERGGYCYTAIHFTRDSVLLAYCAGEPEDNICLNRLRVRRIPLSLIRGDAVRNGEQMK